MSYSGQGPQGPSNGMIGLIELIQLLSNIQQTLNQINITLGHSYIALSGNNVFTGTNTFQAATLFSAGATFSSSVALQGATTLSLPLKLKSYTVATLPAVIGADAGKVAFASDCRNTGQGGGAGTGAMVQVDNTGAWAAVWSGAAPTA